MKFMGGSTLNIVFSRPAIKGDGRVTRQLIALSSEPNSSTLLVGRLNKRDPINVYTVKKDMKNLGLIEVIALEQKTRPRLSILLLRYNPKHFAILSIYELRNIKIELAERIKNLGLIVTSTLRIKRFRRLAKRLLLRIAQSVNIKKAVSSGKGLNIFLSIPLAIFKPLQHFIDLSIHLARKVLTPILREANHVAISWEIATTNALLIDHTKSHHKIRIVGNDAEMLVTLNTFLLTLKRSREQKFKSTRVAVHLDLHEYFPGQTGVKYSKSYINSSLSLIQKLRDNYGLTLSTVSTGLAHLYGKDLKMPSSEISIIWNSPIFDTELNFRLIHSGKQVGNSRDRIAIVHHGISTSFRQLDLLLHAISSDPKLCSMYEVHFYLVANTESHKQTLKVLKEIACRCDYPIYFHEPVAPQKIASEISKYDIAFCAIPPVSTSYANALPNKFFESVHAGLAIIAGTSSDMCEIVNKYTLGVAINEFTVKAIGEGIATINHENLKKFKRNSLTSSEQLSFNSVSSYYLPRISNTLE